MRFGGLIAVAFVALGLSSAECAQPLFTTNLTNQRVDIFAAAPPVTVLLFVRTDCPITNRYAPELKRIADEFASRGVRFWLVYPDRGETVEDIHKHVAAYDLPGKPVRDPDRALERLAKAQVAPEAAVFDQTGGLRYHGRIDDRWVRFGTARPAPTRHDLETAMQEVLAGNAVSVPETRAIGCYLADLP